MLEINWYWYRTSLFEVILQTSPVFSVYFEVVLKLQYNYGCSEVGSNRFFRSDTRNNPQRYTLTPTKKIFLQDIDKKN